MELCAAKISAGSSITAPRRFADYAHRLLASGGRNAPALRCDYENLQLTVILACGSLANDFACAGEHDADSKGQRTGSKPAPARRLPG
jgi:hypothetical protein